MAGLLDGLLAEARRAGRIRADLTAGDLMLAVGMVAGILSKKPAADRREAAELAWKLLRGGIGA
nr:hypothetical protein GCM10020093_016600 [Planobispora longispora]